MTETVAMRATSMLASASIMGAAVIAALTMSVTFLPPNAPEPGPAISMETLEPPPPPETVRETQPPPIATSTEDSPFDIILPQDPVVATDANFDLGPPAPETIMQPRWLRRPSNLQAYYPRRALERGTQGEVVLDCLVSTSGFLDCSVMSETPSGWGFGDAARRIARDHQMVPARRGDMAVEGRYIMRLPFRVE